MNLKPYIEEIHRQLTASAECGGEDARALVDRLVAPLEAAIRLSMLDALAAAAEEITCELAPTSVELRLRGRDPEFVVIPSAEPVAEDRAAATDAGANCRSGDGIGGIGTFGGDDGGMARVNLRMPEHIKSLIDNAAAREGLSVNAWLLRAATAALGRADPSRWLQRHGPKGTQHLTGWAR